LGNVFVKIHPHFDVLSNPPGASGAEILSLRNAFTWIPREYLTLIEVQTELELQHKNGQYVRIWGPSGCVEMDEGYRITTRIPGSFPFGDDGGGRVLHYQGTNGIYLVGYGSLNSEDAVFVAPSLLALLVHEAGIKHF
jgi:hypothetical protein